MLAAVNAKYIHVNPALYSLREYAAPYRDQISVCEFTINQRVDEIIQELYRKKPGFLAFSCYIWNIRQVLEAAEALRCVLPEVPIWLGGPEVTWEAKALLEQNPALTGIMRGEGEETFLKLMRHYADGCGTPEEIPGIVYREGDGIREGRALLPGDEPDMDRLPFLYEDASLFQNRILYYETSRGCPFSCSYCLSAADRTIRYRSLSLVLRDLQRLLDQKVPQVKMVDRTFNANHERAMKIWEYIRDHDNGVTNFHFEIEAHLLREEEVQLLGTLRPGLVQLEIGVQSVNRDTLRAVHRSPETAQVLERAARLIEKGNIHIHLDLIAGLPLEDAVSFRRSFDTVYRVHPHELQLGFLKLLKGSPLWEEVRQGKWDLQWRREPPYEILRTQWLSYDELLSLKDAEEMLEIYYNSSQFTHAVRLLEERFKDPLSLYEELALFWREKGAWGRSVSRGERLELLRCFGMERAGFEGSADRRQFETALLMDLYQREKAKARPSWAPDLQPYREQIRAFYAQEAGRGEELPDKRGLSAGTLAHLSHLEPVFEEAGEADPSCWLFFDYTRRDPVTGNAFLQVKKSLSLREKSNTMD